MICLIKNEYINKLSERKNSSKERDNFIFGICIGSVLLYYGMLNYLQCYHYEKESITYGRLSVIGLVLMIISTIYPNLIDVPYFALRKVVSFIQYHNNRPWCLNHGRFFSFVSQQPKR